MALIRADATEGIQMYNLKQARNYAQNLSNLHGEAWDVLTTHPTAKINQKPGNLFNTGNHIACKTSERAEYVAGGCTYVETVHPQTEQSLVSKGARRVKKA